MAGSVPDILKEGDTLAGRYRLVRPLGEGGMGFVWEARHLTTDKAVAIKVLRSREAADSARFLREARIAAQIAHRNVVQVFDFWDPEGDGSAFMVMELLVGEPLSTLLARSAGLAIKDTVGIMAPVASALRAAHAQGIVHRDLKPENVFLARASSSEPVEVKVLDFGLARPVTANSVATAITQTGSIMGTPFYMSPEQVYGEKGIDTRADVWALGVVLYECLAGQRPFGGENFGQVFRAVTQGLYRPLSEAAPHVPPALVALVTQMLSHDREARPSAIAVCDALSALQPEAAPLILPGPQAAALPITVRVQPTPPRHESAPPPPPPPPPLPTMIAAATSVRRSPQPSRRGMVWSLAGLGGLALVATVVWLAIPATPARAPSVLMPPPPQGLVAPAPPSAASTAVALGIPEIEATAIPVLTVPDAGPTAPPPVSPTRGGKRGPARPAASSGARPGADPLNGGRF